MFHVFCGGIMQFSYLGEGGGVEAVLEAEADAEGLTQNISVRKYLGVIQG
jgi:hypothetical protein